LPLGAKFASWQSGNVESLTQLSGFGDSRVQEVAMHTPRWSAQIFLIIALTVAAFGRSVLAEDRATPTAASQHKSADSASLWHRQHFVCDTGYTQGRCHQQVEKLVQVLDRFVGEIPPDWTWVLVRQEDWREVIGKTGLNPHTPAFSTLARRETFLDESLFAPNAESAVDLLKTFGLPLNQMLELAVSHELGHAFCRDLRELEATRFSEQLRKNGVAQCSVPSPPGTRDTMITLPVPR
jgi:hypothetical protein